MGFAHFCWAVCRYEVLALETGRVPTITKIVWSCRSKSFPAFCVSVLGVLAGLAVLGFHLLLEAWEAE